MIYGIYTKRRPNKNWILTSTTTSFEVAKEEANKVLTQVKKSGLDTAETTVQGFPHIDLVPSELKAVKPVTEFIN